MIKSILRNSVAVLAGFSLLSSCEKNIAEYESLSETGENSAFAHIRFVHASPNLSALVGTTTDMIDIRVGNQKINGVALTFGGLWPASFPTTYAAVEPGNHVVKLSLRGTTTIDSIALFSLDANLQQGKYYSMLVTDSVAAASNDSARIFVEDNWTVPAEGRVVIRFINAFNDTAADKRINVFSTRRNNDLFTGVNANVVTGFSNQPFINIPDTLIIRRTANPTVELARINTITFSNRRVYTLYTRGNTSMATGTRARSLAWYTHR